jgi:prepilin-type N-terminal cleavage/methylation domain-containing protein
MMKTFQKGFTLIELLVVIAIVGILSATAIISVTRTSRTSSVRKVGYVFIAMVSDARKEAINGSRRVVFEFTSNSFRWCVTSCTDPNLPQSSIYNSGNVVVAQYASDAHLTATLPAGGIIPLSTTDTIRFYIEPDGTFIFDLNTPVISGVTIYLNHTSDVEEKFRVAITPLIGKGKFIADWN